MPLTRQISVTIEGGNRHLGDRFSRLVKLQDDLGIEIESIRIAVKGDVLERIDPVKGDNRCATTQTDPGP